MKKVLSVGQCPPDHAALKYFMESFFDSQVTRIDSTEEALLELEKNTYALVLVNRKLDIDYTDGTILIEKMQEKEMLKKTPVMLISNFPEYQDQAVALGAVKGFGKNEIGTKTALERVSAYIPLKS